ncbi:Protein SIP5 [Hypsizygus marmoreus]|uniref:Protein SIP5 n=1 Tax=Hypsizygus marmoreus TaxID=39966 RepID=A0A369JXE5_HYPMA|nr:Protein SIP5 [Hypsizygus marmoreus]
MFEVSGGCLRDGHVIWISQCSVGTSLDIAALRTGCGLKLSIDIPTGSLYRPAPAMGNSSSSSGRGHHDETVDFGFLTPQGVYTGPRDWNQAVVSQLITARRLAPFYRPLEDYEESWDEDQILAARKELPPVDADSGETLPRVESTSPPATKSGHVKRPSALKEPSKPEAAVYRGAVECPICFLYYPPNINHSRCCDQAICTECFVQIKRIEPTATHLISEPAACPYCVQDNFGIVYKPPPWRAGIGSEMSSMWADPARDSPSPYPTHKRRQKSFGADSPEVVTTGKSSTHQIRPDWEAKLAAVRAAVARRANRRIIMRQVGDRLIPVGVTSGRVHALSPEEAQAEGIDNGGSRRSRRRQQAAQNQNFEQFIGMGGQDLEELMLMEAMRLSMIDHEEYQRKEAEEKKKLAAAAAQAEAESASVAGAGPSTLEPPTGKLISLSPSPSSTPSPSTQAPTSQDQPRDSLTVKRNSLLSSLSRSRTPPPPPVNAASANEPRSSNASSSSRRHRSPSPAPYSTLSAAMSAASTASAILGSGSSSSVNGDAVNGEANSELSIPAILSGAPSPGQSEPSRPLGSPNGEILSDVPPNSTSPYDFLPSSPESLIAYEPLLGSRATPEEYVL